jgi:hypothetical protein
VAAGGRRLLDQLADEPHDRLLGPPAQPHRPQGGHRHHGHAVGRVQVRDQRSPAATERQVGQADRHVPAFPAAPRTGNGQQLALVRLARRERLADDPTALSVASEK